MLTYVVRRVLAMIPMLLVISFVSFLIIQLPPGDFFTTLQAVQGASGGGMSNETAELLRERYGLDEPFISHAFRLVVARFALRKCGRWPQKAQRAQKQLSGLIFYS